ncbi:hypothetical protein AB0D63_43205 [Kitasatospora sp. NPDC048343]
MAHGLHQLRLGGAGGDRDAEVVGAETDPQRRDADCLTALRTLCR